MRSLALPITLLFALPGVTYASDKPLLGPVPSWVKPIEPPTAGKDDGAPIRMLLNDEQVSLQPGKIAVYREIQVKIQTPQGLVAGNISLPWRPDTDQLTVHKLRIRRGDKVIDALAGHDFTVLRREQNLEMAVLDGVLTANIQPEGLQVGDVIELATTVTSSDPVLKNHVEEAGATWNGLPIGRAHLRVFWPANAKTRFRASAGLPPVGPVNASGVTTIEMAQDDVQPIVPPKGAPARFQQGRILELTDFASWADLGALMAPLYAKAATLAPDSPIQAEIQRIKSASPDPKARATAALALVQDRIRYVALAMGAGGLTPADADATWGRRYGDCKAKTALLLALLHGLGIPAQAVVVNATSGDGFDQRLPMIALFNHVLVRAEIAGKTYWLDGTRTGDTDLGRLPVPGFDWGLPLVPSGAALVRMLPAPLDLPSEEVSVRIDASKGISLPAPFKADVILRGDTGLATNLALTSLTGEAHDRAMRQFWRDRYDFVEVKSATASFDAAKGEEHLSMEGLATMDWNNGWYETDGTRIGYHADFSRDPGSDRDAPFAVTYPYFNRNVETIVLPQGFPQQLGQMNAELSETIAGVEYRRHATMVGTTVTIERTSRSVVAEFPAKDAPSAEKRLRQLGDKGVYLQKPASYHLTAGELQDVKSSSPTTSRDFMVRGVELLTSGQLDDAIADLDRAIELDPKSSYAYANRAVAEVGKKRFPEATRDIDTAVALNPNNNTAINARGSIAEQQGRLSDAIAAYTRSLEILPDERWPLQQRARLYMRMGNRAAAWQDVTKGLQEEPNSPMWHWLKATLLSMDGKRDELRAEALAMASNAADVDAQLTAGSIYLLLQDRPSALKVFDRAVAIEPSPRTYVARARARAADDPAARADIDAALKLDPNNYEAWAYKAGTAMQAGNWDAALAANAKAMALQPANATLHAVAASIYKEKGETVAAQHEIDAALALEPQNGAALALRATLLRESGNAKQAVADLTAAVAKSDDPGLLAQRAQAEHASGDEVAALRDSEAVLRMMPQFPPMRLLRANIFRLQGKRDDAIAEAMALERDSPTDTYAHVVAGKIFATFNKSDLAMAAFSAALKIHPESYIYINRGESRPASDYAGRLADFDAALKLDPTQTEAAQAKAHLLGAHGDLAGAIAIYDAIIAKRPDEPFTLLSRGTLLAKKGDLQRARADLDKAHASPRLADPAALNSACWMLATANVELERALADCDASLKKLPDNSATLDSRAFVLLRMGRIDDALAAYDRALAKSPNLPASLFGRAVAWARKGDKAKSQADLTAALKLSPDIRETFSDYGVTL